MKTIQAVSSNFNINPLGNIIMQPSIMFFEQNVVQFLNQNDL